MLIVMLISVSSLRNNNNVDKETLHSDSLDEVNQLLLVDSTETKVYTKKSQGLLKDQL